MNASQLVDLARTRSGIPSDYRLSKILGISTQAISNWRAGTSFPGSLLIFRLAELAELPPDQVLAQLEIERAEKAGKLDQVGAWRDMLQRLSGVAASVVAAVIVSGVPNPGIASTGAASQPAGQASTSYTSCSIKARRRRRAAAWLAPLASLVNLHVKAARCIP